MLHGLKKFLEYKAYQMRRSSIIMTSMAGSGHPTSALSAADIVAALFFYAMHYDPQDYNNPNNDRFILSKGHASPIFYAAYKELGILNDHDLLTYRKFGSELEGHPTLRFPYTEAATGSLGMGLSIGAGMAYQAMMDNRSFYTYVLLGDSETTEGQIWEAAEIASYYKLNQLIGILDCNRLGQSTETIHGYHVQRYVQKFEAFGWKTFVVDGHDMQQIAGALDKARETNGRPAMIIAKTIKGYGVDFAENKEGFHGKAFAKDELSDILAHMEKRFSHAESFDQRSYTWEPKIPKKNTPIFGCEKITMPAPHFEKNEMIATRKAYGKSLAALGQVCKEIISLDAEVKNSTYAQTFEEKFPDRFIQCFIAEQNMVSMGVGLQRRGKVPFISTFAAFFSRAYDQIRMAAISTSALRLVGSHAGVSIGEDGPSQMGLEDIALMRALPSSIVLYPADAVATYWLVQEQANYTQGISYLRTSRPDTPVIYDAHEQFPLGGSKIHYDSDDAQVCIVAAGITLYESLKAYELLKKENIKAVILDLYSIKPLDAKTVITYAQKTKNIVTVEDHYKAGGIGEAVVDALITVPCRVTNLFVPGLPRSGSKDELLSWAGIDAESIVRAVKNTL